MLFLSQGVTQESAFAATIWDAFSIAFIKM